MSKRNLWIWIIVIALAVASAVAVVLSYKKLCPHIRHNEHSTNHTAYFDDDSPHADSRLIGKWQNDNNPQWYKVYYDDYDTDGYFWGKEWNEAENVFEVDLPFHGNGWFRWRLERNQLQEIYGMNISNAPIEKQYIIKMKTPATLLLTDKDRSERKYLFHLTPSGH